MVKDILRQPIIEEITDRRLDSRVRIKLPVNVEFDSTKSLDHVKAVASQLSKRGVMLFSKKVFPTESEVLLRISIPTSRYPIQPSAKVLWSSTTTGGLIHGMRFSHIPHIHQSYLNQFLSEHLISRHQIHERRQQTRILSELIEFKNRDGNRIVGFYDHLLSTDLSAPFLIIPAAYGETKINSLHIAYYLANNGFNVIRFDATNHVGESAGTHLKFTLPNLKQDILSSIDYVNSLSPKAKVGIVASSLAARAAYKVISEDSRLSVLISLVGVVNTQYTLRMVQNEDLIGTYLNGRVWNVTNVAGFDVDGVSFLGECVNGQYHNLETTINDLSKSGCPVVFLYATKDRWIDSSESQKVIESLKGHRIEVYQVSSMHKLKENPMEAKRAFRIIVSEASRFLDLGPIEKNKVQEPKAREIGLEVRLERERSRYLKSFSKEDQREFWGGYLRQFHYIHSVADYRDLLDTVYSELGPFHNKASIFDAGCGNGNFGLWLLGKMADDCEISGGSKKMVIYYTGGDIIPEALVNTQKVHEEAQEAFRKKLNLHREFMISQYQFIDLNKKLPFLQNSFDKICFNLVISYLDNPSFTIQELIRVLKPGGRLILTTLKKDADLCQIYRNFIEKASTEIEIEEARNLLSNAGRILLKEAEGYYRFFTAKELQSLLNQSYPSCSARFRPCFADQAIIATISK